MGNPDYCVLHIDCEQAFKPTLKGELVTPLLSRNTVESEMRTNPEKQDVNIIAFSLQMLALMQLFVEVLLHEMKKQESLFFTMIQVIKIRNHI